MGTVEEVGRDVTDLRPGDRVIVPFVIADGRCWFCQNGVPTACTSTNPNYGPEGGLITEKGAALFGYTDLYGGCAGGQAERVRVPMAHIGPRKVPAHLSDEQVLFLTDILPTGWAAATWGDVRPGDTVAVFGCGPVGLMAMKCAWIKGAERVIGIDILPYRLEMAKKAADAFTINAAEQDPVDVLRDVTWGRGPDVCIDAAGAEADRSLLGKINAILHLQRGTMKVLRQCVSAVRRGGRISVVGVYGTPYDNFPLGQIFDKGLTLRFGQTPVHLYLDELLKLIEEGRIRADDIITHRIPLAEAERAYRIFNRKEENCVKVVLLP
jgi:S-(hydroxymethyl)glutathione dehydrogenase / alcohol dehydrogenase